MKKDYVYSGNCLRVAAVKFAFGIRMKYIESETNSNTTFMKTFFVLALSAGILSSFIYYTPSSSISSDEEKPVYIKAIADKDTVSVGEIYKAKLFLLNGKELGGTTAPEMYYMSDYGYDIFGNGKKAIVKNDTGYVEFVVPDYKSKKHLTIQTWVRGSLKEQRGEWIQLF